MAVVTHARVECGVHGRVSGGMSARRPRPHDRVDFRGPGADGSRVVRPGGGDAEGKRSAVVPGAAVVFLRVRRFLQLLSLSAI